MRNSVSFQNYSACKSKDVIFIFSFVLMKQEDLATLKSYIDAVKRY